MQVTFVFAWLMGCIIADRNNQEQLSVDGSGNILGISSYASINKLSEHPQGKGATFSDVIQQVNVIMEKIRKEQEEAKGKVEANAKAQLQSLMQEKNVPGLQGTLDDMNRTTVGMGGILDAFANNMMTQLGSLLVMIRNASAEHDLLRAHLNVSQNTISNMTEQLDNCNRDVADCRRTLNTTTTDLAECNAHVNELQNQSSTHNSLKTHFCSAILNTTGPWHGFLSENFRGWTQSGHAGMTNLPQNCGTTGAMSESCFGSQFTTTGYCSM